MTDSSDTPLGSLGEIIGLNVEASEIEPGEQVFWEAKANRFQARVRSVGGRIYLTDRRLIFAPNRFERKVAGRSWSARLIELERAFVKGPMKTVRVVSGAGAEERFVIWPRVESAERINRAIEEARTAKGG